ncbi:MAG: nicotinate (nicotinamide) nucleotide adenylyltransferase [Burkholderiaceae bacterium]|nr:nicotinate (nicotinamide) nucleotide adenylyltransferase [Burkholderiaceae bacterium]
MGLTRAAGQRRRIGLLGGSFDPVHVGHIALARAAQSALLLDEVHFIPAGIAWQKGGAVASSGDRVAMLQLALGSESSWIIDHCELQRPGASYTIDTLLELRAALGPEPALVLLLGADQFRNLPSWQRFGELLEHCHLAVTQRAPRQLSELPEVLEALLAARGSDALPDAPAGSIVFFNMPPVPVSSSGIRAQLAAGQQPAELLPPGVLDYIESKHLYLRS